MTAQEADQIVRTQFVAWWPTALVRVPHGAQVLERYKTGEVSTMHEALEQIKETR